MSRKNIVVVLLGCLIVANAVGCGGGNSDETAEKFPEAKKRLVGQWQGKIRVDDKDKAIKELGESVYKALLSMRMEVVFEEEGRMITKANVVAEQHSEAREGSAQWEVVSYDGNKIEIRSVDDSTKREEKVAITFKSDSAFSIPYKGIGFVELNRVVKTARK